MSGPRLNEKITASLIRLVVPDGEHVVISRHEVLDRSRKLKLDLVEVQRHADPPVCKLMDYHKEMYVKKAKTKERAKSKAVTPKSDCKEVRFGMKIVSFFNQARFIFLCLNSMKFRYFIRLGSHKKPLVILLEHYMQ